MEIAQAISVLRRRWYLALLVVLAAIAVAAAVRLTGASTPTGSATVQILVDSPQSALADLQQDPTPLAARASVFAQLMTSGAVLDSIARAAGIRASDVTAEGPYSGAGQALDVPTPAEARSQQILAVKPRFRLAFVAQTNLPVITASVQGPTPQTAGRLANSVYPGVESWLTGLEAGKVIPTGKRVTIRQLGDAQAGQVNSSSATILAGVTAIAVLLLGALAVILGDLALATRNPHVGSDRVPASLRQRAARSAPPMPARSVPPRPAAAPDPDFSTAPDAERLAAASAGFDSRASVG